MMEDDALGQAEVIIDSTASAVQNAFTDAGLDRLITRSMLVYECIDADGERRMGVIPSPDTRGWDLLAMAGYADIYARELLQ